MPIQGVDNVKKMLAKNKREANKKVRGVFLAGLGPIIEATPADKGRARNNWFLTVGAPSNKTTTSASVGGGGSLSQASKLPKIVLGKKIFFTNNLPYINILEYGGYPSPVEKGSYIKKSKSYEILSVNGYSKQAPTGWVRKAVILMRNKIRSL